MIVLLIILGILLLLILYVISIYNKLVQNRNLMQEAWSGIDVFLKKRHDLVPNLVETVKGYAAHEKQTLEEVMRCRSGAMNATNQGEQIEMEKSLGNALGRLIATVEHYPELKANTNFLTLQRQLAGMEEELALSRRYYNGTVRENNIKIESFPSNIIAGWFNFAKGLFFEIDKREKEVPNVSF
jgi:LemA protein